MAMARSVENACRSRRLAGTTSMPAGQRSRTAASAAVLLELEARDEAEDVVGLLLLIEPVRVGVVIDGLLLSVIEVARVRLLEDFVPGRRGQQVVLLAALARRHVEELLLRAKIADHPTRAPARIAYFVVRRGVCGGHIGVRRGVGT